MRKVVYLNPVDVEKADTSGVSVRTLPRIRPGNYFLLIAKDIPDATPQT